MMHIIRKKDWLILSLAAVFLGVAITLQYSSLISPKSIESNEVMALEIEKIVRTNSELKNQVSNITKKNQSYRDSLNDQSRLEEQINSELEELKVVNSHSNLSGQGVLITLSGRILEAQLVDLINAIKNIGCDGISINGERLTLYSAINISKYPVSPISIEIVGNSSLIYSALSRKGGIVEQLQSRSIDVKIDNRDRITLVAAAVTN